MDGNEVVLVNSLWWRYENSSEWVLKNVNLKIAEEEFIVITGPNGAGKTTLVRVLTGLIPHSYRGVMLGDVYVLNHNVREANVSKLSRDVGVVFQEPEMQFLTMSVEEEISLALRLRGFDEDVIEERVLWALDVVGLDERFLSKSPYELSNGQKQRVAIATALAMKPKLLILDEPTSMLDPAGREEIYGALEELRRKFKTTVVVIEHKLDLLLEYINKIFLIVDGEFILSGSPEEFFESLNDVNSKYVRIPEILRIQRSLKALGLEGLKGLKPKPNDLINYLRALMR